ncbi:hypothetical protein DPX16_20608 [Anabarilius grahami]|uniref:Uncharacterized protein n=1 Tax=Anabarilius grahami TaxID=495550 RepID=A0A3N0YL85_ANAGA|nr:hypothetical protein DPX16_20608 [Anabarilius grahami]
MSVSSSTSSQGCSLHLHVESKPQSKTAIRKDDRTESAPGRPSLSLPPQSLRRLSGAAHARTRAFFSGGALISAMRLMAHYRPIHKYCLQYYHFQGPLSSPEIYSSLLHHAIVFLPLPVFHTPPSVLPYLSQFEPHRLPQEDDGGGYLFHLELKQGQRNIK